MARGVEAAVKGAVLPVDAEAAVKWHAKAGANRMDTDLVRYGTAGGPDEAVQGGPL